MDEITRDARAWLADVFADCPADLTDAEVHAAVERHYVGGWAEFAAVAS